MSKYENKTEFYCLGKDFEPYLETEEDFRRFQEMKKIEASGELNKPASQCAKSIFEYLRLERLLTRGAPVFLVQGPSNPILN